MVIIQDEKIPKAIWELKVLKEALDKYGENAQLNQMQEEFAEAIVAINHYRRGRNTWKHVLGEISDCQIMIDQFKSVGDNSKIMEDERQKKLLRLVERMNKFPTVCKCGMQLMQITDPEILVRTEQTWHVCPMILEGCDEVEHTSIYEDRTGK